jgi:hypothetical protein
MSTLLVGRLRNLSDALEKGAVKYALAEAADRIEHLETALRRIAEGDVPLVHVDDYARKQLLGG